MHDNFDTLLYNNLTADNQALIRQMIIRLQPQDARAAVADLRPFVPQWKQHMLANGISPTTIKSYSCNIVRLLEQFPAPTKIDIEFYITVLKTQQLVTSTLNSKIVSWKSFFAWCADNNIIPADPTAKQRCTRSPYRHRRPPEQNDVKKLLSLELSLRDRALLSLIIDCGLRVAEVSLLLLADVTSKSITVLGKGNKKRTVPLTSSCFKIISDYIDTLPPQSKYLFAGRWLGTAFATRSIEDRLEDLCKLAGIKKIVPHQLRHYFATQMLNKGANLKSVSEMLGHTSTAITADIYWHTDEETNRKEHDAHSPLSDIERLINAPTFFNSD